MRASSWPVVLAKRGWERLVVCVLVECLRAGPRRGMRRRGRDDGDAEAAAAAAAAAAATTANAAAAARCSASCKGVCASCVGKWTRMRRGARRP
jgi:hypothetical protein